MSLLLKLFLVLINSLYVICIEPGPKYAPTKGEVWPEPQYQEKKNIYYILNSARLDITKPNYTCDILEEGIKRLLQNFARRQSFVSVILKQNKSKLQQDSTMFKVAFAEPLIEFRIELSKECEKYPHLDMDEKYLLTVGEAIVLSSDSIWGILRGMQTFNQLIHYSDDYTEMRINDTIIEDYPAYKHRGLLIDTGRHYLKLETIHLLIDALEMNKMNVLHWHIVDDQSFPYQSKTFPNLSKYGAYHSSMVYTQKDIQQVIERGRLAGIRVVPEFDIPGHVRSWGQAYPTILTKCFNKNYLVGLGPLNPIKNVTYTFLALLYKEVKELFPDEYIHLGGDEVDTDCWQSNPNIQNYLKKHHKNVTMLHAQFMSVVKTLLPSKAKYILWQDVFDSGVSLPNKTILQVWRYEYIQEMDKILKAGHRVVFSSSWYLDEISMNWETYFKADPRQMVFEDRLNASGLQDIIGGEACMWGEKVDDANIFPRVWPRTSAVAERLWTGMNYTGVQPNDLLTDFVRRRMEEHACRMRQNGIPAEPPNGPGFCFGTNFKRTGRSKIRRNRKGKIHLVEKNKAKKYCAPGDTVCELTPIS